MAERPEAARIALPRSPSSVATARRFIAARPADWSFPEPAADQLVLIGSELVTNAVLHARTELTLTLELREDRVRISVKDRSLAQATLRHYRPDALTGRPAGHPVGPAGRRPRARPVRFPGVPVDGYLELQAHNDALFRKLELIGIELEGDNANQVAAPRSRRPPAPAATWPCSSRPTRSAGPASCSPPSRPSRSSPCAAGSSTRWPASCCTAPPRPRPARIWPWRPTRSTSRPWPRPGR